MEPAEFTAELARIAAIAAKPPEDDRIFQHKYDARAELVACQAGLLMGGAIGGGGAAKVDGRTTQQQLARVSLAMGINHIETEENSDGLAALETAQRHFEELRGGEPTKAVVELRGKREAYHKEMAKRRAKAAGETVEEEEEVVVEEPAAEPTEWTAPTKVDDSMDEYLLEVYNNQAAVWSNRSEHGMATVLLQASEAVYHRWIATHPQGEKGGPDSARRKAMEDAYTTTCFFLAQVHGHGKNVALSSKYCHLTLQKQLESRREFDHVDWATNCMHLSGFYLGEDDFAQSHHCCAAAEHVLPPGKDETADANLQLAWGKYWLHVMKFCKARREESPEETDPEFQLEVRDATNAIVPPTSFSLPISPPPTHLSLIYTFEQARDVFRRAMRHYEKAVQYYVLDGFVSDYIGIQMDISQLYRQLIFWETDIDRQVAMHKRRYALYDDIIGHLNVSIFINNVRQLLYERGEICNEMCDLRLQQRKHKPVGPKKINEPIQLGVDAFNMFLHLCLPDADRNQGTHVPSSDASQHPPPAKLDEELHHSWVMANMHVARMTTHIQATPAETCGHLDRAARRYRYILEFAAAHNLGTKVKEGDQFHTELSMCREMAALLPGKIKEIQREMEG